MISMVLCWQIENANFLITSQLEYFHSQAHSHPIFQTVLTKTRTTLTATVPNKGSKVTLEAVAVKSSKSVMSPRYPRPLTQTHYVPSFLSPLKLLVSS